ncbi:DUF956 family protein [Levilactobacillus bambusae]|uniref:Uncharacterized protein n=1 Tax=Levilactobacillus bambusae TaxID=2024736 RepID=A0A2V1MWE9_9LACO|nr:DUF956 family protein [Levilactobacillus bambusae]PWF99410.1 hypothetical protein DCM90_08125 [Levilactobacillus bambusae]
MMNQKLVVRQGHLNQEELFHARANCFPSGFKSIYGTIVLGETGIEFFGGVTESVAQIPYDQISSVQVQIVARHFVRGFAVNMVGGGRLRFVVSHAKRAVQLLVHQLPSQKIILPAFMQKKQAHHDLPLLDIEQGGVQKFYVEVNPSFRFKYRFHNREQTPIFQVPVQNVADFWNMMFGWLLNAPTTFAFQTLRGHSVTVRRRVSVMSGKYTIEVDGQSVGHLDKHMIHQKQVYAATWDNQAYTIQFAHANTYFSMSDEAGHKVMGLRRDPQRGDYFVLAIENEEMTPAMLGFAVAILNSYSN